MALHVELFEARPPKEVALKMVKGVRVPASPHMHYKDEGGKGSGLLVKVPAAVSCVTVSVVHGRRKVETVAESEGWSSGTDVKEEREPVCVVSTVVPAAPRPVPPGICDGFDRFDLDLRDVPGVSSILVHFRTISRDIRFRLVVEFGEEDDKRVVLRAAVAVRSKRKRKPPAPASTPKAKRRVLRRLSPIRTRRGSSRLRALEERVGALETAAESTAAARALALEKAAARMVALEKEVDELRALLAFSASSGGGAPLPLLEVGAPLLADDVPEMPLAAAFGELPGGLFSEPNREAADPLFALHEAFDGAQCAVLTSRELGSGYAQPLRFGGATFYAREPLN